MRWPTAPVTGRTRLLPPIPRPPPARDYRSALVVVPPPECCAAADAFRKENDAAFARWMPHVNLLWPFVAAADHEEAAQRLREALRGLRPAALRLETPVVAKNTHGKSHVYLPVVEAPVEVPAWRRRSQKHEETAEALRGEHVLAEVRRRVCEAFPELAPRDSFEPFVTLGHVPRYDADYVVEKLGWEPVTFPLDVCWTRAPRCGRTHAFLTEHPHRHTRRHAG